MDNYERRRMVIDQIIRDIENEIYKKDDKLPSDREFSETFNISRLDVRKAFEVLEGMGYVYSLQGRGRFAMKNFRRIKLEFLDKRGFNEKLKKDCYQVETKNLSCDLINYEEDIYSKLQAKKEDKIYKLLRLRLINDLPVAYHISYLKESVFKNINFDWKKIKEINSYYKKNEIEDVENKNIELTVEYASRDIRKTLNCKELIPILKSEHNVIDNRSGDVIEFTNIFYRGDIFKFSI